MGYDAFISYSHSVDGRLAPAVQTGLQRLARPWYRRRSLEVFRDQTGLSANPQLWTSIQHSLDESRYFIWMASPESAASPWVGRELGHWLGTKTAAPFRILPVLTDGELVWDDTRGGFDPVRSTALPAVLADAFVEEPRFVDLRWAHEEEHLDLRHSQFREAVADLAAPLHGMSKSELESEDIRRHRRALRLAVGAALGLLILAVAATVSLVFALRYASNARASERHAVLSQVREDRATRTAKEVTKQKNIAERARDEATRSEDVAKANAVAADDQRELAARNAAEAQSQRALAEKNAAEATQQRERAEQNAAEATQQRERAEKNATSIYQQAVSISSFIEELQGWLDSNCDEDHRCPRPLIICAYASVVGDVPLGVNLPQLCSVGEWFGNE